MIETSKKQLATIRGKWSGFVYNFRWSDWVSYIDGWIPKFAFSVPIFGYLILFNDSISEYFMFNQLAREDLLVGGLSGIARLRFVYFGLIFLGLSNLAYKWQKPYLFRFGSNLLDFTNNALNLYTYTEYLRIHNEIRSSSAMTPDGKYYDSEWEGFIDAALNKGEGTVNVRRTGDWESAKNKYGSLLKGMLREQFFRDDIQNRFWLSVCILMSTVGYIFVAVPSIDIFIKVMRSIVFPF